MCDLAATENDRGTRHQITEVSVSERRREQVCQIGSSQNGYRVWAVIRLGCERANSWGSPGSKKGVGPEVRTPKSGRVRPLKSRNRAKIGATSAFCVVMHPELLWSWADPSPDPQVVIFATPVVALDARLPPHGATPTHNLGHNVVRGSSGLRVRSILKKLSVASLSDSVHAIFADCGTTYFKTNPLNMVALEATSGHLSAAPPFGLRNEHDEHMSTMPPTKNTVQSRGIQSLRGCSTVSRSQARMVAGFPGARHPQRCTLWQVCLIPCTLADSGTN